MKYINFTRFDAEFGGIENIPEHAQPKPPNLVVFEFAYFLLALVYLFWVEVVYAGTDVVAATVLASIGACFFLLAYLLATDNPAYRVCVWLLLGLSLGLLLKLYTLSQLTWLWLVAGLIPLFMVLPLLSKANRPYLSGLRS